MSSNRGEKVLNSIEIWCTQDLRVQPMQITYYLCLINKRIAITILKSAFLMQYFHYYHLKSSVFLSTTLVPSSVGKLRLIFRYKKYHLSHKQVVNPWWPNPSYVCQYVYFGPEAPYPPSLLQIRQ